MLPRPRRLVTPVVLAVAVATFAGLAASSHGFPVEHVSLNDGSIWVTDNEYGAIERFDDPIGQLDGQPLTLTSGSPNFNVWQDGPDVAAYDATGGRMYAVDSYSPAFSDDSGQRVLPESASPESEPDDIALGDTTLAVLSNGGSLGAAQLSAGGGSLSALAQPLA